MRVHVVKLHGQYLPRFRVRQLGTPHRDIRPRSNKKKENTRQFTQAFTDSAIDTVQRRTNPWAIGWCFRSEGSNGARRNPRRMKKLRVPVRSKNIS